MGVQRVAPGRVVVQVRDLVQPLAERGGHLAVVLEVLLAGAAGQLGRRRAALRPPSTSATNAVTHAQREKPRSWMSCSGVKKLPDCRKARRTCPGDGAGRSIASAPSEAPIATGAPRTATSAATAGSTPRTSAPAYSGDASTTRCGRRGRRARPVRRQRAARDHRGAVVRQAGQVGVLGAVVGDQQQRLLVAGVRRAPEPHRDVRSEAAARHDQLALGALDAVRVEPRRRLVAVEQQHGLVPERSRRGQRVAGVEVHLAAAAGVHQLGSYSSRVTGAPPRSSFHSAPSRS